MMRSLKAPLLLCLLVPVPGASQATIDDLDAMQARLIGPAGMSGRVAAIDVVAADPTTMFVGAATGGVWRSRDGGISWRPWHFVLAAVVL